MEQGFANTVTERWTATGTNTGPLQGMAPTGKRAVTEGCTIAELNDDGFVTSETDYWNEAAMMRQLGFLPEQAAATV